MNDTIDGLPVTKRAVRFEGELGTGAALRAGQTVPLVVLVHVGDVEHTPGHDEDYHRVDVLQVARLASPRSTEENEYLLALLRGEATHEVTDEVEDQADDESSSLEPRAGGGLQAVATPAVVPSSAEPADDDDFVLPPPPPVPEGKETRRQIVPGDPQLRNFLGE